MKFECDNKNIEEALTALISTLKNNGAWFDKDLKIISKDGELGVEYHGNPHQKDPLITLPDVTLVPSEHLGLEIKNDQFRIDPKKGFITDIQLEIAGHLVTLYNLTDKVKKHKNDCTIYALKDYPDVLKSILKMRSLSANKSAYLEYINTPEEQRDHNDILCKNFLYSRILGHEDHDNFAKTRSIMPIVELVNHHVSGSNFQFQNFSNQKKVLNIHSRVLNENSKETYVFYFYLDALDSFINYNFTDQSSFFVRSIPLEIPLGEYGNLKINSTTSHLKSILPPSIAHLKTFMPALPMIKDDTIEISHFMISTHVAPHASRRVLFMILNAYLLPRGASESTILDIMHTAEQIILETNISAYKDLDQLVSSYLETNPKHVGLNAAMHMIKTQQDKLNRYVIGKLPLERISDLEKNFMIDKHAA